LFLTGVLNGLLSCGLLYAALLDASTNATAMDGALFMLFFGLGTWPALIALRMGGGIIGPGARTWLRKASPVLVSVVAVLMILRGLELGIPYVSPGAVTVPAEVEVCH
ncbi:MAG: sulfite exporter TauE/SafE family protein, partial [Flavobacteriales bacterium]|nr:sulfite exporter TauE/SafE family protein [Flavobacteriales bacterium]